MNVKLGVLFLKNKQQNIINLHGDSQTTTAAESSAVHSTWVQ